MPKSRLLFHVARTKKLQENCTIRMGEKKNKNKKKEKNKKPKKKKNCMEDIKTLWVIFWNTSTNMAYMCLYIKVL